jgi:hypothetical protein
MGQHWDSIPNSHANQAAAPKGEDAMEGVSLRSSPSLDETRHPARSASIGRELQFAFALINKKLKISQEIHTQ